MIGYNPQADYLLDPQQRPDKLPRCGICKRQIYYGEVYYTMFIGASEINICSDCYSEIGCSSVIMED